MKPESPRRGPKLPTAILGIKIEGDTDKFLDTLRSLGPEHGNVYLYSMDGDVLEAIKLGRAIRRLRLSTEAPVSFPGYDPICALPTPSNHKNCGCMSACFLVYAGGIWRYGNHLGLHRPYLSREQMQLVSDIDFEKKQKVVVTAAREYLEEMDIPPKYIEAMMAHNSKQLILNGSQRRE